MKTTVFERNDQNDFGDYDNLNTKRSEMVNNTFQLLEYQQIQHSFHWIDPELMKIVPKEGGLDIAAKVLEQAYQQCLRRCDN